MIKCQTIDSLHKETINFVRKEGKTGSKDYLEMPYPITVELTNPLARYFCYTEKRDWVAYSVAEMLYTFIGMNGNDLLWEFDPNRSDPRQKQVYHYNSIGMLLRFYRKQFDNMDYNTACATRSKGGFEDQVNEIVFTLKNFVSANRPLNDFEYILQLTTPLHKEINNISQAYFYGKNGKLNILVYAGSIWTSALFVKYLPIFAFLLQVITELSGIEMGSVQFTVARLCSSSVNRHELKKSPPIVNMEGFAYKQNDLTLSDLDTLSSMLFEFVSRLDERSLSRANPFERDDRLEQWSDYAEVFRAWKAEKLGYKLIKTEQNFFHPQLRYIYKGEVL